MKKVVLLCLGLIGLTCTTVYANDYEKELVQLANTRIKEFLGQPLVVDAIKKQNEKHTSLSKSEILDLDNQWRAETKTNPKPLINAVLQSELSEYLAKVKDQSQGLYNEVFIMDDKGLNVGQSDITSDYWQGDEAKWKQTYNVGGNAVHVSEVEMDDSTQQFQSQVSVSIIDPKTKKVIGAATVGVNVDNLP